MGDAGFMREAEKIDDAVNLLKNELYKLGDSVTFDKDSKKDIFLGNGTKKLELRRKVNSYEVLYFENTQENKIELLGTIHKLSSGLSFAEGKLAEEFPERKIVFNEETAKGLISKLL